MFYYAFDYSSKHMLKDAVYFFDLTTTIFLLKLNIWIDKFEFHKIGSFFSN